MMNLLTEENKTQVRHEYRARLVAVVLFGVFATILIASALLAPSYIIASLNKKHIEEELRLHEQQGLENGEELQLIIAQTNERIATLSGVQSRIKIYKDVIEPITQQRGSVQIHNISYRRGENSLVHVSGRALDRDSLRVFIENLKQHVSFEEVDAPVSNFVNRTNLEFSLEIVLSK